MTLVTSLPLSCREGYAREVLAVFPGFGMHNDHPVLVWVLRLAMLSFGNLDHGSFRWALGRAECAPNCVRHSMVDRVLCLREMVAESTIASFSLEELRIHADRWCRGPGAFEAFLEALVSLGSLPAVHILELSSDDEKALRARAHARRRLFVSYEHRLFTVVEGGQLGNLLNHGRRFEHGYPLGKRGRFSVRSRLTEGKNPHCLQVVEWKEILLNVPFPQWHGQTASWLWTACELRCLW